MSDVIDLETRSPRPPGPPDLKNAARALNHALDKATCQCVALRELLLADYDGDAGDEFVTRARRYLVFELFEAIGDAEAAWKEMHTALWAEQPK